MSYHRGGHPGAVAVSYSTSTMAPLSPSRRYSGSNGSGTGGTSSTTGGSTSKYSYRSSGERAGSYYSSASTTGFRTSSFSSSSDSYRRPYISPARSVSSYNETSSTVGSSTGAGSLRYGSASSSSASSTTSSTSSSASRDRNGLHHPSPGSLATSTADLYAKYSPTNYVPNIYGSSGNGTSIGNGHWRPSSSSSSSNSSSVLAELHGGDEYDSCRDRRGRSYSSDVSSGIGNSGKSNIASPGLAERWSTRREAKRRTTPVQGSGGTVLAGHAQPAPTEVTLIADGRNNIYDTSGTVATNSAATSSSTAAASAAASSIIDEKVNDGQIDDNRSKDDENPDSRDLDNNNPPNGNDNNNNDGDSIVEQRRRRRRGNVEQQRLNGDADSRDYNETTNVNNETVVARNNRDFKDESKCSEIVNGAGSTSDDCRAVDHHHGRKNATDKTRGLPSASLTNAADNASNIVPNASAVTSSSSAASDSSFAPKSASPVPSAPAAAASNGQSRGGDVLSSTKKSLEDRGSLSAANLSDCGGGGAGGDADHHRTAYTWTKIPTNLDNTELLTNDNGQDREAAVLGIGDEGRNGETNSTNATTRNRADAKSLPRTAANEIGGGFESRDEIDEGYEGKDAGKSSAVSVVINDGDKDSLATSGATNGLENEQGDGGEDSDSTDFNSDDCNGIALRINGVTGRPSGSRNEEPGKPSTSRRTLFDDRNAGSSSAAAFSSTSNSNNAPVAVHQNLYRGLNEQIDEGSNSRPPRNRLQSRRDERYGLNGLRNIGNTCFMNSVIQCLSNTRPLLEYLLNEQHLHDINTTTSSMKGALIKAFGQVIHELWEMSGDHVVNTTALKSQIQRFAPRFMGYSQQDAQEFLRYLLEGLHEDVNRVTVKPQPILTDIPDHYSDSHKAAESWKRYLRSEDSTIVDVFVGQLRSSLQCTSCDHVSVTLDPVWDLSLPIPARSGTVKLNQCLEHFTKVETMDGDEKPTCSKCQMRRKCTKSFSIQKFPKILVIHLKRFSPTERFRGKLSVLVDFPLMGLDLSAFAAPGVQGCTYNLYGVANHSGTTYSGHYTAYCKHPYSGDWHEYNDNRVSTVPARSVVSSEAYVLFYEQQPLSPHL